MTSVFDGLARIIEAYKKCLNFEDYLILSEFVQAVHDLQHQEGTHRIDLYVLKRIIPQERFQKWCDPFSAEKLVKELLRKNEGE